MINTRMIDWNSVRRAQEAIHNWANHTFPGRRPESSLYKLVLEEIPELLLHRKVKGIDGIGEEMADCFILLLDLCAIWKIDLPSALRSKMAKNARRVWTHDKDTGFYNHMRFTTDEEDDDGC